MLDAKYKAENRDTKIPEDLKKMIRDVSISHTAKHYIGRSRGAADGHLKVKSILTLTTPQFANPTSTTSANTDSTNAPHTKPPAIPSTEIQFSDRNFSGLATQLRQKKFGLLPAEILQIMNHLPTNHSELTMIVEETDLRFPDKEGQAILDELLLVCQNARVGRDSKDGGGES